MTMWWQKYCTEYFESEGWSWAGLGGMLIATVLVVDVAPDSPVALYEMLSAVQFDAVWV